MSVSPVQITQKEGKKHLHFSESTKEDDATDGHEDGDTSRLSIIDSIVPSDMSVLVTEAHCEALSYAECEISPPSSPGSISPVILSGKMTLSILESPSQIVDEPPHLEVSSSPILPRVSPGRTLTAVSHKLEKEVSKEEAQLEIDEFVKQIQEENRERSLAEKATKNEEDTSTEELLSAESIQSVQEVPPQTVDLNIVDQDVLAHLEKQILELENVRNVCCVFPDILLILKSSPF